MRINEIYVCCEDRLAWRFSPLSQLPNNSLPDFVLATLDGISVVEDMVGEGKVKTKNSFIASCQSGFLILVIFLLQFHSVLDNPKLANAVARIRQGDAPS